MKTLTFIIRKIGIGLIGFSFSMCPVVAFAKAQKRGPSQSLTCVPFSGQGAKRSFITLYINSRGHASPITVEKSPTGDMALGSVSLFCKVNVDELPEDPTAAIAQLKKIYAKEFRCGYFIADDGVLTACRDIN